MGKLTRLGVLGAVSRWASRLRFPYLVLVTAVLFVLNLLVPDFIPLADELIMGFVTAILVSLKKKPGTPATLATGLASGTLNGAATIGGPPVILFFFSSQAGVDISRASVIAYFFATDILASIICIVRGLILQQTLALTAVLLIPLVIGIQAGNRSFFHTEPETFKKRVMILLMVLSLVSLVRSLL